MRRLVIAAAVGAAVVGTAVPTLAASTSTPTQSLPVGVSVSDTGGLFVGTTIFGQPGVGAFVANGRACVGFSYEVPVCTNNLSPIDARGRSAPAAKPAAVSTQSLPGGGVVVYHDSTRTAVGVGDVGVVIYSNGRICPVVSTQDWPCLPVQLG